MGLDINLFSLYLDLNRNLLYSKPNSKKMQSLFGALVIFAILAISIQTTKQIEATSCINNNHVICELRNGSQACCPIKDGVCCQDSDYCCPKGILWMNKIISIRIL